MIKNYLKKRVVFEVSCRFDFFFYFKLKYSNNSAMHEMSIALSIVEAVDAKAREEGAAKITGIDLLVGRLSGIETESLKFCFSAASKGSLAEDAVLAIDEREGTGECTVCRSSFPVSFYYAECPECGSLAVSIISGEEFQIKSMTIEEEGE